MSPAIQQILKNIKKGATLERARQFTKDCHKLGLVIHGDFIMGLPGETHETINNTIAFAKELDVETIQVSVAHAYPGTELYDYAMKNGFMVGDNKMVDEGGHQLAQIQYPGLPADDIWRPFTASTMSITSVPRPSSAFSGKRCLTATNASACTKKRRAS